MDPALAIPEFMRILRPGGVFAAWWNITHRDSEWEYEQGRRITEANPDWRKASGPYGERDNEFGTYPGLTVATHEFAWQRTIPLDRHLDNLVSRSYIAELPDRDDFLRVERAISAQVPMAVVDARRCAHGLTSLRVAGASIMPTGATKKNWSRSEPSPRRFVPLALTAPGSISTSMSDLQSQMHAAMAEALRARQKKRDAAEALGARQHEYEIASLRGRQQQINRARVALEAAE